MWSYSGDPSSSVVDAVRFEVQDTNVKAQLLQDEEIEYVIGLEAPGSPPSEGEVLSAAARCMEALARLFAMQADTEVGALKVEYTQHAENYAERAKECRERAIGLHGAPWTGGISEAERKEKLNESDLIQPAFYRKFGENPYAQTGAGAGFMRPGETGEGS